MNDTSARPIHKNPSSLPRFRDIAEPKMVALHVGHASGSKVFQSYLDNHPQMYMLPAYPLLYFYPHWRRWERELRDNWNWETIIRAFCIQHASVIDPRAIPGPNGMTGLGDDQKGTSEIDGELFKESLKHILEGEPIAARTFLLAVHYAYAICRDEDLQQKRVLVYHIHVQAYVSEYLLPDFPDALVLGMVRDQRANQGGRYAHSVSGVHDLKLNRSDAILLRRRNYYEVYRLLYHPAAPIRGAKFENMRVVRLEDLHLRLEATMKSVADFLGIDFHPCLLESTFNGLRFWGDSVYAMAPTNGVNPRVVSDSWKGKLAPMDWFVVEGLFFDYLNAYGYTPLRFEKDSFANRIKLFFCMLLPSKAERTEFLTYLKPSNFLAFLAACNAEATGEKPFIDYSFNAYYRHRWGREDLQLWKPRWYKQFVNYGLAKGGIMKQIARATYIAVNIFRYVWATVSQPFWVLRRWPMSIYAFSRLVNKNFNLPLVLPGPPGNQHQQFGVTNK